MSELLLIRHGPAAPKSPDGSDRERPLTPEGRRIVEALAGRLRADGLAVDHMLCSAARRTRETAEILLASRFPAPVIEAEDALYAADGGGLLQRLRAIEAAAEVVFLVAHNPAVQELALALAGADRRMLAAGFPPAATARFEIAGSWSGLTARSARLVTYYDP